MMQFDDPMQFWSIFASAMAGNAGRRMRSKKPIVVVTGDTIKSAVITADSPSKSYLERKKDSSRRRQ